MKYILFTIFDRMTVLTKSSYESLTLLPNLLQHEVNLAIKPRLLTSISGLIIITSCNQHGYPWYSPPLAIVHCRSSRLHPVSAQSCCMSVLAGRPAFARLCEGVHWSTSLMSSYLLLQLCPACLVRLTLIVSVMGGRWPYSCCFVRYCLHVLFNIARSILV